MKIIGKGIAVILFSLYIITLSQLFPLEGNGANALGFLPAGLLLPLLSRNFSDWKSIIFTAALTSMVFEGVQEIFKMGAFRIGDIFFAIIGAMTGYAVVKIFQHPFQVKEEEERRHFRKPANDLLSFRYKH
ncbi:VanZ family protein [Thalassobacillus pellis]|uniref:VanZ family protein n=1 Tax=Thalassobacillus pellis TaxID=748008 RepID=UPI00195F4937|nr:VanZ family protein [Thalassobacillus pellis]MBM7553500.1 glycopeptide antibiotics resistance protein [Thalassobacillus pellis]